MAYEDNYYQKIKVDRLLFQLSGSGSGQIGPVKHARPMSKQSPSVQPKVFSCTAIDSVMVCVRSNKPSLHVKSAYVVKSSTAVRCQASLYGVKYMVSSLRCVKSMVSSPRCHIYGVKSSLEFCKAGQ